MWLADAVGRAHAVPRAVTNRANDAHWYVVPQVDHSGHDRIGVPSFPTRVSRGCGDERQGALTGNHGATIPVNEAAVSEQSGPRAVLSSAGRLRDRLPLWGATASAGISWPRW